jgi:hypothetical protein
MKGTPSRGGDVAQLRRPSSSTRVWLSTTQGPAIRKNGWSAPASKSSSFMPGPRPAAPAPRAISRAACNETAEQRVAVTRVGAELRVELAGQEPGVVRQFDHLDEAVHREARETPARRCRRRSR